MAKNKLTQERLKELLHYNPETGIFIRKTTVNNNAVAGDVAGNKNMDGYIRIGIDMESYLAHRLAWLYVYGYFPEGMVDHINIDPSDNRIENLREASKQCNARNSCVPANNTSGIKGVSWHKGRKLWRAHITINRKTKYLGMYENIYDAAKARWEAEVEYGFPNCMSDSSAYRYIAEK